jgi:hypothetical protein
MASGLPLSTLVLPLLLVLPLYLLF